MTLVTRYTGVVEIGGREVTKTKFEHVFVFENGDLLYEKYGRVFGWADRLVWRFEKACCPWRFEIYMGVRESIPFYRWLEYKLTKRTKWSRLYEAMLKTYRGQSMNDT